MKENNDNAQDPALDTTDATETADINAAGRPEEAVDTTETAVIKVNEADRPVTKSPLERGAAWVKAILSAGQVNTPMYNEALKMQSDFQGAQESNGRLVPLRAKRKIRNKMAKESRRINRQVKKSKRSRTRARA